MTSGPIQGRKSKSPKKPLSTRVRARPLGGDAWHRPCRTLTDGTDYVRVADTGDEDFQEHWDVLRMVLEDAPRKLTRQQILDEWQAKRRWAGVAISVNGRRAVRCVGR